MIEVAELDLKIFFLMVKDERPYECWLTKPVTTLYLKMIKVGFNKEGRNFIVINVA